jgi:2-keto-4-pentenoate hydratase/2-oxohepta-3-ene-1,7-dioic acid hydratase in catechol pathway
MRIINADGRLGLLTGGGYLDVETASNGAFDPDPQAVYDRWDSFHDWARDTVDTTRIVDVRPVIDERLQAPVPRPRQVFAFGVNYRDHAAEAGIDPPAEPMVFTKFPSAITGPYGTIELPGGSVDFEAELVAVIGRPAYRVPESGAWSYVAGLTIGQDLSERETQLRPPAPAQYNLGKSYPGFAPLGPYLVTPDEFADPDDLAISCSLNGEQMQKARTSEFVFTISQLVSSLSHVLQLFPGDVIFTGTPGGIGWTRNPKRLIRPDDELTTVIEGIGQMRHRFSPAAPIPAAPIPAQRGVSNV